MRGWLAGDLSDQFARAAIDRLYALSEQTRAELAASPTSLADSRAVSLTRDCEQLSRTLAGLAASIERGDRAAAHTALLSPSHEEIGNVVLGVVTSIGGFAEVGSVSTSAQAGAQFGLQLLWAVVIAALILAMFSEMSGRLAAVSGRTFAGAVRGRFGFHFQLTLLVAELLTDFMLLTAEIGGTAIALHLLTGIDFRWFFIPIGVAACAVLWLGSFGVIEYGLGFAGLVTLAFVVAAWQLHPGAAQLTPNLIPSLPTHDAARYAFLVVSIVGATVSPYLLNFYASGAVEEKWGEGDLWSNRITAFGGIGFGAVVSMATIVVAAFVLGPKHIQVESYEQAALMFVPMFGHWAVLLFAAALGVGCFSAAVEIALNGGYVMAQGFGWPWGANKKRLETARFSGAMTLMLIAAMLFALVGFDPLRLTLISVGVTVIVMPLIVLPMLVLMNDKDHVKGHCSGPIANGILAVLTIVAALMAVVVVPLEIVGGG